ncbi:MAG: prepilin-type N-terminal cleavage/methylation domain-containing protein [Kiritimatiellae bacterium]|jgi:prepilin-type N-terminal cleavage/methylation domain-containing protein|nr:prepilin-type N-terminal cleavage/methylation domain-containing protein [Kiritimatiellia bacterium]
MKRGFTILELLVAALLLGMLVTVLTMIFNQSSIAWRTGVAGLLDMDEVRDNVAAVRDEADSIYIWNNEIHRTLSIWKESGTGARPQLRKRAIDSTDNADVEERAKVQYLKGKSELKRDDLEPKDAFGPVDVKQSESEAGKNWIVNVKSRGPNGVLNDYDDIWSNPDDFE